MRPGKLAVPQGITLKRTLTFAFRFEKISLKVIQMTTSPCRRTSQAVPPLITPPKNSGLGVLSNWMIGCGVACPLGLSIRRPL